MIYSPYAAELYMESHFLTTSPKRSQLIIDINLDTAQPGLRPNNFVTSLFQLTGFPTELIMETDNEPHFINYLATIEVE